MAITDIAGCGNNGLYIRKSKDLSKLQLLSDRLGARDVALNLDQLPGCPPHWDLDEIPVIAAGFLDSEAATSIWGNARRNKFDSAPSTPYRPQVGALTFQASLVGVVLDGKGCA